MTLVGCLPTRRRHALCDERLKSPLQRDGALVRTVAKCYYNPAAGAKYEWLGLPYEIQGAPQREEDLRRLSGLAQGCGLDASIG
jgi:hypothetical protein